MVGGHAISVADASPQQPASTSDIIGGLLAGIVAAVLATGIWYGVVAVTQYQVGLVAIAVGFVVGTGSSSARTAADPSSWLRSPSS